MRAHPLPEARQLRRDDARGAAQGHPVVPHPGRPARARRRVERTTSQETRDAHRATLVAPHLRPARRAEPPPGGHAHRLRSRRRGQGPRRDLLPAHAPARGPAARPGAHARRRRPRRAARARTWGSDATVATSRAARSSAPTTASTSLADYGAFRDLQRHRMLTIEWQPLSPAARLRGPRGGRRSRGRASAFDDAMERSAALLRRAGRSGSPSRRRTRCRSRTGMRFVDADERARGDAPARAAHHAAGSPGVPAGRARRCTG